MKYKKKLLSLLEKIEIKKIEKKIINIKNMSLKQEYDDKQLKLLIEYEKEYIKKIHDGLLSGICIYQWKNYNNFISILHLIIKDNRNVLQKNQELIKEKLKTWSESQHKLKFWKLLNATDRKQMLKLKKIKEQIINNNYVQLKFLKKG